MPCRPYFLLKDFRQSVRENGKTFFLTLLFALMGVALGVYIGLNTEEEKAFRGIFSLLFSPEYAPLTWTLRYFGRFLLYFAILYLGYFFLTPWVFAVPSILLFGKYISETVTLCVRFDSLLSAVFSFLLVYLPLFTVGTLLYFYLLQDTIDHKICHGNPFNGRYFLYTLRRAGIFVAVYLLLCILIFFVICGIVYLLIAAV